MVVYHPRLLLAGLMLAIVPCRAAEEFIAVEGKRVGVNLVPENPVIMVGEPAAVLFTLHNYSDADLQVLEGGDYRNKLGRQNSFKVSVYDAGGAPVPQPDPEFGMGGIVGPRDIPAGGSYSFRLFLPHWAQIAKPGTYSMRAGKELVFLRTKARGFARDNVIKVAVEVAATFAVVPVDQAKLGELINAIGATLVAGRDDTWPDSPAMRLAAINDERVIPWYAKAFATRSYEKKFAALTGLAKFNHADAFSVLQQGMEAKAADFGDAAGPALLEGSANNIRGAAASALSQSPYPGARTFLLSRRDDAYVGVRFTILHVLGKMPSAEALPILEEMAQDKDWRVSQEAKRYIGLLRAK